MSNAARTLSALRFYAASGSGVYYEMRVLLAHTSATSLSTVFVDNYGGNTPEQVAYLSELNLDGSSAGWKPILFDTMFSYNGTDNLLIEIQWNGGDGTVHSGITTETGWKRVLEGPLGASNGTLNGWRNVLQFAFLEYREISGYILDADGSGVAGVNMLGLPGNPATAHNGIFTATVVNGWSGTITPQATGYQFVPASRTYDSIEQPISQQNFSALLDSIDLEVAMRPALEDIHQVAGSQPSIRIKPSLPEHLYTLQYKLNLAGTSGWQNASGQTAVPGNGEPIEIQLAPPEHAPAAFFRVIMQPAP
jgi:hypothetical protein